MNLKNRNLFVLLGALAGTFLLSSPALAYIGPGAGLGAVAVAFALVLGVILLLVGLVWYPLKRLIKGNKVATVSESEKDIS